MGAREIYTKKFINAKHSKNRQKNINISDIEADSPWL